MTTSTPAFPAATILGYPRIGADRELKFALEDFWKDSSTDLPGVARSLRESRTGTIKALGLEGTGAVPEDFSYYDQVLDILLTAGAVPERFAKEGEVLKDNVETPESPAVLEAQFTIARGEGDRAALEMTKWFDSNYHYLVPEIGPETRIEWTGSPRIGAIEALGEEAGLNEVSRQFTKKERFTYWDYQDLRFPRNEGVRIDFQLASPTLAKEATAGFVDVEERAAKGASDHAPVVVDYDLPPNFDDVR